jgi:hypothetical protein
MSEKPYKVIIEGQNGAGNQVFEAETPEELQSKFQEAQTHATAKIREQAEALRARDEEIATLRQSAGSYSNGNGNVTDDEATRLWKEGIAKAFKVPSFDILENKLARMDQITNFQEQQFVNNSLIAKHPELLEVSKEDDRHNANEIKKIAEELGAPYTEISAEACFALAKERGRLRLGVVPVGEEVRLPPVPTTVTRPAAAANTSESREEFLRTAPTEDVRKFLEKEWAGKQRA